MARHKEVWYKLSWGQDRPVEDPGGVHEGEHGGGELEEPAERLHRGWVEVLVLLPGPRLVEHVRVLHPSENIFSQIKCF